MATPYISLSANGGKGYCISISTCYERAYIFYLVAHIWQILTRGTEYDIVEFSINVDLSLKNMSDFLYTYSILSCRQKSWKNGGLKNRCLAIAIHIYIYIYIYATGHFRLVFAMLLIFAQRISHLAYHVICHLQQGTCQACIWLIPYGQKMLAEEGRSNINDRWTAAIR